MADDRSRRTKLRAMADNGTPHERAIARTKLGLTARPLYYVIDAQHNIRSSDDIAEAAPQFEDIDLRRVGADDVGDAHVSTVFLVIDHNHVGSGPPILFETMIFGGEHSDYQRRYATWDAAAAGHRTIVENLRAGRDPTTNDD